MASSEVSDLTAAGALDGTETLHLVQSGNSRRATTAALLSAIQALSALSALNITNTIPVFDTGAPATGTMSVQQIFDALNLLGSETAPATGHRLALYDTGSGTTKAIAPDNLLKIVNLLTTLSSPDRTADFLLAFDADTASAAKLALSKIATLADENQPLTGGATVTSKDLGTQASGTLTLDMGDRPLQHYVNGGAHTLAPGSVVGACLVDITNNASAGAITISGWTHTAGDSFTTTNGDKFRCHCSVGNNGSLLVAQAMQ